MEINQIRAGSESTFLPFLNAGTDASHFALYSEILGLVFEGGQVDALVQYVAQNILNTFSLKDIYLLKHEDGQSWQVSNSNSGQQKIWLSSEHAIAASLGSGAIGLACTNGQNYGLEASGLSADPDTYQLLMIPLIDNLVPKSVLVAIIGKHNSFSPADVELFNFLQAIISFAAYGAKSMNKTVYEL